MWPLLSQTMHQRNTSCSNSLTSLQKLAQLQFSLTRHCYAYIYMYRTKKKLAGLASHPMYERKKRRDIDIIYQNRILLLTKKNSTCIYKTIIEQDKQMKFVILDF